MQNNLQTRFEKYIKEENLFTKNEKGIVGLSGGKDSMVLAALMHDCGYNFIVAHCNFHLRNEESDADQALVEKWCRNHQIEYYIKHFDTYAYAQKFQISVEMAARDLRYAWFKELQKEHKAQHVDIAHHMNDQVETFFLNLTRGTGIKGLAGMKPKNGAIARPLLFAWRKEIDAFAESNAIPFRNDHTNDDTRIKRNFVRHKIIPLFKELNPSILETMQTNMENLQGINSLMEDQFAAMKKSIVKEQTDETFIQIPQDHTKNIFIDFLLAYFSGKSIHFTSTQLNDIVGAQPGAVVSKNPYKLYRERDTLILSKNDKVAPDAVIVNSFPATIDFGNYQFYFEELSIRETDAYPTKKDEIWLSADELVLPLTIRTWQAGDRIQPIGMTGSRKIKKVLTDKKVMTSTRKVYPVVCDQENIVWLPYLTVNRLYKITEKVPKVLRIKITKK